jgi:hypothetical protein
MLIAKARSWHDHTRDDTADAFADDRNQQG